MPWHKKTATQQQESADAAYDNQSSDNLGSNDIANGGGMMVACPQMCIYCFDVLIAYIQRQSEPPKPSFTDDA